MRQSQRERFFAQLLVYSLFLCLYVYIVTDIRPVHQTFGVHSTIFDQTSAEEFPDANFDKRFSDVATIGEFWEYSEQVLFPALYSSEYFNGDPKAFDGRFSNTIAGYNTLIMPLRLRSVRVQNSSCDNVRAFTKTCWGRYSADTALREPFGAEYGNSYKTDLVQWSGYEGFGEDYGTEGYVVDIPLQEAGQPTGWAAQLKALKGAKWIDESTRAVSIHAGFYNANLDIHTYVRWSVDISPSGRFQPWTTMWSLRLNPYSRQSDTIRLVAEGVFVVLLLGYLVVELSEMRKLRWGYFLEIPNWIDMINYGLYIAVIVVWVDFVLAYVVEDKGYAAKFSSRLTEYDEEFAQIAGIFRASTQLAAFNIVWAVVKVFKYLQLFPSVMLLWEALANSMVEIVPFFMVIVMSIVAFTFAAHWTFGHYVLEFHSFTRSFFMLVRTVVAQNSLPYDLMRESSPTMAVIFVLLWTVVMLLIIVNMFVGIITDSHDFVMSQHHLEQSRMLHRIGNSANVDFFRATLNRGIGALSRNLEKAGQSVSSTPTVIFKDNPKRKANKEDPTIFDPENRAQLKKIHNVIRGVDTKDAEAVRQMMVHEEVDKLTAADLANTVFAKDPTKAHDFLDSIIGIQIVQESIRSIEARELQEQQRVSELTSTVDRLVRETQAVTEALSTAPQLDTEAGVEKFLELQGVKTLQHTTSKS
uniref:Polycystin cation channel PKD1/PKD2 domain-containing protein n=1 Tax=Oxyrrhis marina TaxID=2969 RepID=A0A7S4LQ59_OXYMA|mmetsp:Transcript_66732/g.177947  ORF Transcript_66732/g.177947 Transcript_66732/m.177947 type:complete len:696 (-) Transcript_66732:95-2182(-)